MKRLLLLVTLLLVFSLSFAVDTVYSATKYKVTAAGDGVIKGVVTFKGTPKSPDKIQITKNPEFCGEGTREVAWVRVNGDALTELVVYLDKVKEGKDWPAPDSEMEHLAIDGEKSDGLAQDGTYVINQQGCRFHPWIRIFKKGAGIIVRNSDPVLHNIHMREIIGRVKRTMFNFGQPKKGDIKKEVKPRKSDFIRMNCEAHNFMFAWALAANNPYAAVVGKTGTYEITGIPAGEYTVKAWHPTLGVQTTKVTVAAGGSVTQDFLYESGKKYKTK